MSCISSFTYNPPKLRSQTTPKPVSLLSRSPRRVSPVPVHSQRPKKLMVLKGSSWDTNPSRIGGPVGTNGTSVWPKVISQPVLLLSSLISAFNEQLVSTLHRIIAPPLHPSVDPRRVFTGNFAPVDELEPTNCPVVEGQLPSCLNGVYIRNGSNPQHRYEDSPLHFFEGDGMLHSLKMSKGQATYCCRYVKTYKYMLEQEAGFPFFPNFLTGLYRIKDVLGFFFVIWRVVSGHINLMRGFGIANTSIAFFANKLLALGESDLPYKIHLTEEGDIKTVGRWEFDGKLFANMTAHPKVDMDTNEAFAFRFSPFYPFITYFRFSEDGVKQEDVPFWSVKKPCFIHDFAVTKRFAIFPDTNLVVKPMRMMLGKGMPVVLEPGKEPRIGIIPRYATSDSSLKWFPVPGFNAMHVISAWDQGEDEMVLVAPNIINIEDIFQRIDRVHLSLEKLVINIRTGHVSRGNNLSEDSLEFGSIHEHCVGKKTRYAYIGIGEVIPKMSGLVKMDLDKGCEAARRTYGPGCFGGEPSFVAREENNLACEDDGYVVSYVHNENTGESSFLVMDARSPELEVVATVKLPRRVPYGFHGLFVREKNLGCILSANHAPY